MTARKRKGPRPGKTRNPVAKALRSSPRLAQRVVGSKKAYVRKKPTVPRPEGEED
ncbi:MAG: hypothetical protein U1E46_12835 [Hyphomicrobiales bacterium]